MFSLSNGAAVISACPAVLGFVPEASFVMITVGRDGMLGVVLRVDLDGAADALDEFTVHAVQADSAAVIVVIVDREGFGSPFGEERHAELVAKLDGALKAHGVAVAGAYSVDRIAKGGHWRATGSSDLAAELDDPATSVVAVAAAVDGRQIRGSRAELVASVAADLDRVAVLMPLVAAQRAEAGRADVVAAVLAAADVLGVGGVPGDGELAAIAAALVEVDVRDGLYVLAVGEMASPVEMLWELLARALSGQWRAHALTLLGLSAYLRGDGPLAMVAALEALKEDDGQKMAKLLDAALQAGMHPERLREMLAGRASGAA